MGALRFIVREMVLNLVADRRRTILMIAIVAVVTASLTSVELRSIDRLWAESVARDRDGLGVVIASGASGLPAHTCEAFNGLDAVRGAGGVFKSELTSVANGGVTQFPLARITPGLITVWEPNRTGRIPFGPSMGADLAAELAVSAGATVHLKDGETAVLAGVIATNARSEFYSRWMLLPSAPIGLVAECWVEFDPADREAGRSLVAAAFATPSSRVDVRPLMELGARSRSLTRDFQQRPGPVLAWVSAVVVAFVLLIVTWFRRSEIALYRALGVTRGQLTTGAQLESLILVVAGTLLGVAWAAAMSTWSRLSGDTPVPLGLGASVAARSIATSVLTVVAVSPILVIWMRSDITRDLKDR